MNSFLIIFLKKSVCIDFDEKINVFDVVQEKNRMPIEYDFCEISLKNLTFTIDCTNHINVNHSSVASIQYRCG